MSDTHAITAARAALDGFMDAFNAQDAEAIGTRWFHFPHVRFHSGKVTVMERPEHYDNLVWRSSSQAKEWARSAWDYIGAIDAGPNKVHFHTRFTRFRADGAAVGSYRSLYLVTLKDGRWAILKLPRFRERRTIWVRGVHDGQDKVSLPG